MIRYYEREVAEIGRIYRILEKAELKQQIISTTQGLRSEKTSRFHGVPRDIVDSVLAPYLTSPPIATTRSEYVAAIRAYLDDDTLMSRVYSLMMFKYHSVPPGVREMRNALQNASKYISDDELLHKLKEVATKGLEQNVCGDLPSASDASSSAAAANADIDENKPAEIKLYEAVRDAKSLDGLCARLHVAFKPAPVSAAASAASSETLTNAKVKPGK